MDRFEFIVDSFLIRRYKTIHRSFKFILIILQHFLKKKTTQLQIFSSKLNIKQQRENHRKQLCFQAQDEWIKTPDCILNYDPPALICEAGICYEKNSALLCLAYKDSDFLSLDKYFQF